MTIGSVDGGEATRNAGRGEAARPAGNATPSATSRGRWKLLAILLVCASPVIASFFTYFVVRPEGRTNYGTLLEQRSIETLQGTDLQERPLSLATLRGRWALLVVASSDCDAGCRERLYQIRQVRLTTGKDRERVARVWLVDDAGRPDPALLAQHEGLTVLRAPAPAIAAQLPATDATRAADHIWLIDPRGHLIMRFPSNADPSRIKKDLAKLLRASQIG